MKKNSKIYVAGHTGLVGSSIMEQLISEGYTNLITKTHDVLDLTNQQLTNSFFEKEKPEYVFLAAAKVGGIWANNTQPAEFIQENLQISVNVIDAAYRNNVKKLIYLGSSCIYPKHADQPIREEYLLTGELEPTNEPYAMAKIAGIKMCEAYRKQYGFNSIAVMPTNLYGRRDNFDLKSSHVLPAMIRKFHLAKCAYEGDLERFRADEKIFGLLSNEDLFMFGLNDNGGIKKIKEPKMSLWGTGSALREFMHVDDMVDACIYLMNNYDSNEIINIGVGKDITIRDLAKMICEIVGYEGEIFWDSTKPDGTPRKLLDVSKLNNTDWKPKISLKNGIIKTYQWYTKQIDKEI